MTGIAGKFYVLEISLIGIIPNVYPDLLAIQRTRYKNGSLFFVFPSLWNFHADRIFFKPLERLSEFGR